MAHEERTRGRPPLSEREKAFRMSARLYARVLALQEQAQHEADKPAEVKPGRPATPVSVLLRETRRKWRESMVVLHALEAAEGLKPSKPAQLVLPTYSEERRPGRPAMSQTERISNEIEKERAIIEGLIAEISQSPAERIQTMESPRMGRPPRSPEERLVTHRARLIALQKDLIKARKVEEKEKAAQARAERQRALAQEEIRKELRKTQQHMEELRKKLAAKSAGKVRAKATV